MAPCPCPGGGPTRGPLPARAPLLAAWAPLCRPPSRALGWEPSPPAHLPERTGQASWGLCRGRPSSSRGHSGGAPAPRGSGVCCIPTAPLGRCPSWPERCAPHLIHGQLEPDVSRTSALRPGGGVTPRLRPREGSWVLSADQTPGRTATRWVCPGCFPGPSPSAGGPAPASPPLATPCFQACPHPPHPPSAWHTAASTNRTLT